MANESESAASSAPAALLAAEQDAARVAADAADQWLNLFQRAAGETLTEPSLDVLLRAAVEAIAHTLSADAASLVVTNEDGTELVGRAAFGLDEEVDLSISLPVSDGVSGQILSTGEATLIADLQEEEVLSEVLRSSEQRSFVGVPVRSGGRNLGVLHATRRRIDSFGEDDVALLVRFAQPIAAALERVRLFKAEHRARERAEEASKLAERAIERVRGLQRITSALASAATVQEICTIIINEAAPGGVASGERAIWMLSDSRLLLVAGLGLSANYPEIPLDPSLPAAENLRDGRPLFVETRAEIARRWPILAAGATAAFAGLPLIVGDFRLGVMAVGFREEHTFESDEREYLVSIAEQASSALMRAEGRSALQRARQIAEERREQLDFLAEAGRRLGRSLDLEVTLQTVAELGVTKLADRCALYLLEESTITERALAPHPSDDERQLFASAESPLSPLRGIGEVIRSGQPQHIAEFDDAGLAVTPEAQSPEDLELLRRVGIGDVLIVPLQARGHSLGALAFVNRPGRPITEADRSLAEELAARAAMAIDNALMYTREAHVARRLSESLLPSRLPEVSGLDIAALYRAGSTGLEVGGDFYDVFAVGEQQWLVLVGDVQGKGVEAAAVTGLARHTIRSSARYEKSPAALLSRLNSALIENIIETADEDARPWDHARLCTAAVIRLDRERSGWRATASCAGHPSPLLRHADSRIESICQSALLLGVLEDQAYEESVIDLDPGSCLVLFTDGLSDRVERDGVSGNDEVARILSGAHGTAREITDTIAASVVADKAREDDVVILTIRLSES